MSDKLQVQAKRVTRHPGLMILLGYIIGWIARELYFAFEISKGLL